MFLRVFKETTFVCIKATIFIGQNSNFIEYTACYCWDRSDYLSIYLRQVPDFHGFRFARVPAIGQVSTLERLEYILGISDKADCACTSFWRDVAFNACFTSGHRIWMRFGSVSPCFFFQYIFHASITNSLAFLWYLYNTTVPIKIFCAVL